MQLSSRGNVIELLFCCWYYCPDDDDDDDNNNCETETYMSMYVGISGDKNLIMKEEEKITQNKNLTIVIQCVWTVKTKLIPVIVEATGTTSKSFRKYVGKIPGKHETEEMQTYWALRA